MKPEGPGNWWGLTDSTPRPTIHEEWDPRLPWCQENPPGYSNKAECKPRLPVRSVQACVAVHHSCQPIRGLEQTGKPWACFENKISSDGASVLQLHCWYGHVLGTAKATQEANPLASYKGVCWCRKSYRRNFKILGRGWSLPYYFMQKKKVLYQAFLKSTVKNFKPSKVDSVTWRNMMSCHRLSFSSL